VSHLVWALVIGAAVVGLVAGIRAVRKTSAEATAGVGTLVAGIPAAAGAGAAAEDVRAAIPSLDAYFAESGTYAGLTTATLRRLDPGLDQTITVAWARADRACVQSTVRGQTASARRPTGDIVAGPC
jgi:hypothetical protein